MKLRAGLVGLGPNWDHRHKPALRSLGDRFDVRAICDQVSHRAHQAAREFGAVAVDGYQSLARRDDIDAVLLLGEQWYGQLPVFAACDHGKAVYCAIPPELDLASVREIQRRVHTAGIAFTPEVARRHAPATLRLKELIATRLGQPRLLFCHRRIPAPDTRHNGDAHRHTEFLRALVELVDWCCYVVGYDPTSVVGMTHHGDDSSAPDDYQMLSLDFAAGAGHRDNIAAQISCGRYVPNEWPEALSFRPPAALQVACDEGIAFMDLPTTLIWFDKAGRHMESLESERPIDETMLAQFYRDVTSLVRKTSGIDEMVRDVSIVLKARTSHEEGRKIRLDESDR